MKVVIDTNVLVSAAFRDRLPERVVLWCVGNQRLIWLATDVIIEEYFGVLRRPKFGLSSVDIARWTNLLAGRVRLCWRWRGLGDRVSMRGCCAGLLRDGDSMTIGGGNGR